MTEKERSTPAPRTLSQSEVAIVIADVQERITRLQELADRLMSDDVKNVFNAHLDERRALVARLEQSR